MKIKYSILSFAILFIVMVSGCSSDDFEAEVGLCPEVTTTNPENGAIDVPLDQTITVLFNKDMNPATFNGASFFINGAGTDRIAGEVSISGALATFKPTAPLKMNTTYTGTVTTSVKDTKGNALQEDHIFTFSTGQTVLPMVASTDPVNLATNVFLNKTITASFNMLMDPTTINTSTFTLTQGTTAVVGAVTYSSQTVSFDPTNDLTSNTEYTATITTGTKNTEGTAIEGNYTWKFTTGTSVAPKVVSTDPINNATGVPLNKVITANFSAPMDPLTFNTGVFTLTQGATVVAGTVSYSGQTASFMPTSALLSDTEYTAKITTEAKNVQGIALVSEYTWKFVTGNSVGPTVVSNDPEDNATGVELNKIISADFSVAMDPTTINSNSFTLKSGATVIAGNLTYTGVRLSFEPTSPLVENTTYAATITTEAKSTTGVSLSSNYEWTFKTLTANTAAIDLGSVGRFGIFAAVGVSNNAGFSEIKDLDVGISPGLRSSVTGFPPAVIINGAIYASDDATPVPAMLIQAKADLTAAYLAAAGATVPAPATVSGDQGGLTLAPGIYKSTSTLLIQNGDLTLDAQGDPNATWIFQVASSFTTIGGAGGNIILAGGAKAKNIFWQVGSSATVGDYTIFKGNILALTSVTMNSHAVAEGRMLCINGSIVMTDTNVIAKPAN
ncbi:MAG: Ig-like domain-containing protein [Gelidibacter sp.]